MLEWVDWMEEILHRDEDVWALCLDWESVWSDRAKRAWAQAELWKRVGRDIRIYPIPAHECSMNHADVPAAIALHHCVTVLGKNSVVRTARLGQGHLEAMLHAFFAGVEGFKAGDLLPEWVSDCLELFRQADLGEKNLA